jgi:predicted lipoprotein with Yx(FWY)xxD motif
MLRSIRQAVRSVRAPRAAAVLVVLASAGALAVTGLAAARSFTLRVDKTATVGNKHESIIVNAKGFVVYVLSPETTHHVLCKKRNQCLSFWPPVTVASARSKPTVAAGIKGKLGLWHRDGFFQVTLNGHPLYTFVQDKRKGVATGNDLMGFGGTWHVVRVSAGTRAAQAPSAPSAPAPTMTGTPTMPYPSGW